MRSLLRLAAMEMKLFVREPIVLTFVFAFPVLTVLVLGGVFDDDDPNFEGALPSDYYVAAYIAVVIAAIGLVMLPVHLASYRERGVLRRFDVSRYPRWALPAAWILVAMAITIVAIAVLLVTGQLVYGLPKPDDLLGVAVGTLLGAFTFISIGIALGLALPSARSAQGLGMLLFFPFFLLGGAGPPPTPWATRCSRSLPRCRSPTSCAPCRSRGSISGAPPATSPYSPPWPWSPRPDG